MGRESLRGRDVDELIQRAADIAAERRSLYRSEPAAWIDSRGPAMQQRAEQISMELEQIYSLVRRLRAKESAPRRLEPADVVHLLGRLLAA